MGTAFERDPSRKWHAYELEETLCPQCGGASVIKISLTPWSVDNIECPNCGIIKCAAGKPKRVAHRRGVAGKCNIESKNK